MVTMETIYTRIRFLWRSRPFWQVAGMLAAIMELVLFLGNSPQAFLFKSFFALLAFAAIGLTVEILKGKRAAILTLTVFCSLVAAVNVVDAAGRYDIGGWRNWVPVPKGLSVNTSFYTYPDSPRWKKIDRASFKPYVFVSLLNTDNAADVILTVNGIDYGRVEDAEGVVGFVASYAVPIPWRLVDENEYINVKLTIERGDKARLFVTPWVRRNWHQREQTVSGGVPEQTSMAYIKAQNRYVIELRVADDKSRVIGIIF